MSTRRDAIAKSMFSRKQQRNLAGSLNDIHIGLSSSEFDWSFYFITPLCMEMFVAQNWIHVLHYKIKWRVCSLHVDYIEIYFHMINLWLTVLINLVSTIMQNHMKFIIWCNLYLKNFKTQLRVTMTKIPLNIIDFEQV